MAAKTPASEAVGTYGADQYMKSRVFQDKNAKPRFKGKENGGNGNNEFDAIWFHEPTNTYYVVEAKGYEGRMRPKTISGTVDNPTRAQQGSKPYFEDTLQRMADANGTPGQQVAREILDARANPSLGKKVIYLGITTAPAAGGSPQFSIAKFKISSAP